MGNCQESNHLNHVMDLSLIGQLLTLPLEYVGMWLGCSLCNVSATSYETLEGHSQGKKHRAKCKAVQAKMNPPTTVEHSVSACDIQANGGAAGNGIPGEQGAVSEQTQNLLECKKQSKKRKAGVDSSKTSSTPTEELQETIDKVEDGEFSTYCGASKQLYLQYIKRLQSKVRLLVATVCAN